jgi:hypothetical protein
MTTKTSKILYNVLFNNPKLKQFWNSLIQKGLLDFDPTTDRFKTTAKGRAFLKAYNVLGYDVIYVKTTSSSLRRPLATMEHLMRQFFTVQATDSKMVLATKEQHLSAKR